MNTGVKRVLLYQIIIFLGFMTSLYKYVIKRNKNRKSSTRELLGGAKTGRRLGWLFGDGMGFDGMGCVCVELHATYWVSWCWQLALRVIPIFSKGTSWYINWCGVRSCVYNITANVKCKRYECLTMRYISKGFYFYEFADNMCCSTLYVEFEKKPHYFMIPN